jgi:hypothetical protein
MNVTTPAYAHLINKDGMVAIAGELIQYGYSNVKTIKNGDISKVLDLNRTIVSDNDIEVLAVNRNRYVSTMKNSRVQALTSCTDTNDNYRLIVYEDFVTYGDNGTPCPNQFNDYYLTLRSLKRTLGQWFNHRTGYLGATTNYAANHRNCDGTLVTTVGSEYNRTWNCVSDIHTCWLYMIQRYNTGICTNTSPNCNGQIGFVTFAERYHTGRGKNATTCNVGSW